MRLYYQMETAGCEEHDPDECGGSCPGSQLCGRHRQEEQSEQYLKNNLKQKRSGGVTQAAECLPSK
jgi:hypothetical protein